MVFPSVFLLLFTFYLFCTLPRIPEARPGFVPQNDASNNDGRLGAVASESSICSHFGTDMLKLGGNAADAMVATVFCVGVTSMYHSGIGGGGFMLIRMPNGTYEFIDFRESAPAASFEDMFKGNKDGSMHGGLASGVPGEIRGLEYLHKTYGKLSWSTVLEPAINTARNGFPVTEDLVRYMRTATEDAEDFLSKDPTWAIDFAPNGTRLGLGDIIHRRRYADTLESISQRGAEAFYSGPIAETMVNAVQASNGTMTLEDLTNYTILRRDVAEIEYRGYKIASTTAPSSGAVVLSALKIVEGFKDFFHSNQVNLSTHRLAEAMRFAYGQRTELGDPRFIPDLHLFEKHMLNETVADRNRRNISDYYTQNISVYDPLGIESLDTPGTSHISTADNTGLAISLTTTVNLLFGSQVMVPETGIIMNNEMNDFSIPGLSNAFGYIPSPANFIRPGKRPLSSICPSFVTHPNGTLYFVSGAAGGSRIITSTLLSIVNVLDRGMNSVEALREPRFHDQLVPDQITLEYSFDNSTTDFLISRKHNITWVPSSASAVQAIRLLSNGTFEAAGEPRQLNSGGYVV
ncbi:hypothetical protein FQN57_002881 [Myotisia sp. PD_48]|nr:hypothetical protein FQN57_002881 [Myotisia sp. PD_48]